MVNMTAASIASNSPTMNPTTTPLMMSQLSGALIGMYSLNIVQKYRKG